MECLGELKGILGKGVAAVPHVYHFHIDHNAPFLLYLAPNSPGYYSHPKRNRRRWLCKNLGGGGGKQGA